MKPAVLSLKNKPLPVLTPQQIITACKSIRNWTHYHCYYTQTKQSYKSSGSHLLSKDGLQCFCLWKDRLCLAEFLRIFLYSLHFQKPCLSSQNYMSSKAMQMWEINLTVILPLDIESVPIKLLCFSFTYWKSLPNFCSNQTVICVTVSSPEGWYIKYTWMPSPFYQDAIYLIQSSTSSIPHK